MLYIGWITDAGGPPRARRQVLKRRPSQRTVAPGREHGSLIENGVAADFAAAGEGVSPSDPRVRRDIRGTSGCVSKRHDR